MKRVRLGLPSEREIVRKAINRSRPEENSAFFPNMIDESLREQRLIIHPESGSLLDFYPLKKKSQVTIYNIYIVPEWRGQGLAREMVDLLREMYPGRSILARCPLGIPANGWYERMGFNLVEVMPPEGRRKATLNVWVLDGEEES